MSILAIGIIMFLVYVIFKIHNDVEKAVARVNKLESLLTDTHNIIEAIDERVSFKMEVSDEACKRNLEDIQREYRDDNWIDWKTHWSTRWEEMTEFVGGTYIEKK